MQVSLGATFTDPARKIVAYAYEDSGAGILVGQIPEAGTAATGALILLAAGAISLRRRRAA